MFTFATDDQSPFGLMVLLLYLATTAISLAAALRASVRSERLFWGLICLTSLALGINKHADLQTSIIALGRTFSQSVGLYSWRREAQIGFSLMLAFAAFWYGRRLLGLRPKSRHRGSLALSGVLLILAYALIRAAHLSHLPLAPAEMNMALHLLEPGGLIISLIAAGLSLRRSRG